MNKIGILVIAGVVALGSCLGLVKYANGAEDRAVSASEPVPVMVAVKDVPVGATFTSAWNNGDIAMSQIPRSLRPATAVQDPTQLAGLVASAPLAQGQFVVAESFVSPDPQKRVGPPTFAAALPAGTVAVSFKAEAAQAVSDLVRPGDHVNLLVQVPNAAVLGLPDSGGAAMVHMFQDLEIIAIGDVPAPAKDAVTAPENPGTGLYTVAIRPEDSARLLLLASEYPIYLTLIGPDTTPSDLPPIADHDAMPALDASQVQKP
jgi:Flp pilus assembly protein CpaB